MPLPVVAVIATTIVVWLYLYWTFHVAMEPDVNGDAWYMRRAAFTDNPVSPPYCWRPLLPWLARWLGFGPVTQGATLLTPLALYGYLGGGWNAAAMAIAFVGIRPIFAFNVKNQEYAEGLGHLLFVLALWGMRDGTWWAVPAVLAATLCREALGAALAVIAILWAPLMLLPIGAAGALAYFTRREDKANRHPLVESTSYGTFVRWAKVKRDLGLHFAHTLQTTRLLGFSVPFVWHDVSAYARLGLAGILGLGFFAIPASGQSRHYGYAFALLAPFAASLGGEWCWLHALVCWFWPYDYACYNESGGTTFGYAR